MTFLLLYWKQIVAGLIVLAVLAVLAFTYWLGGASGRTELAEYKAKVAAQATVVADLATKAERIARETEQAHAKALADVAEQYEQDKQNAQADADRLVADLRAGNRKLRDLWKDQSTASVSGVAASTGGAEGQARLREESISRVLAAVAQCEAQVTGLQAVTEADRVR